ncbi:MAG: tRNA preQ1(34) S-adenosylmethionine ribosyltransferase-isomerase QueA [Eubacteriaceae bacterium]|nr:tRNA preQ1(34) S-adenosylmethionine ribosyltransferase-isomerase QueA [Eubacteriaceae bacterium]
MKTSDFYYELPDDLIAQHPLEERDSSRLMVMNRETGELEHRKFYNIIEYMEEGDTLVLNDTRVMPARLFGVNKLRGGKVEILLLKRINLDDWQIMVKPGKKAKPGDIIVFDDTLEGEIIEIVEDGLRIIRFSYEGIFEEAMEKLGHMPLPPYITETLSDRERYQTIYSRETGSAAAPTAGLHFTPELMEKIRKKGINIAYITLHVGIGTFRPVKVDDILDHKMHQEYYSITKETADMINEAKRTGKNVIAVGTTTVRTLESAAKKSGIIKESNGWTDIFIYPPYNFKIVNKLITNFHLPESTLLMLVSAFSDREKVMKAYQTAVREKYRFFSFGDSMYIG